MPEKTISQKQMKKILESMNNLNQQKKKPTVTVVLKNRLTSAFKKNLKKKQTINIYFSLNVRVRRKVIRNKINLRMH